MSKTLFFSLAICLQSIFSISASATIVVDVFDNFGGEVAPFYAQDLSVAKRDPNLTSYVGQAFTYFRTKKGYAPSTEIDRAIAVVDWVSYNLRHAAFWPEDPRAPRQYSARSSYSPSATYAPLNGDPVKIIATAQSFPPTDNLNYKHILCSDQNYAAAGMLNNIGIHARIVQVEGHSGLEYYSFSLRKWIWMDSTFNEHYGVKNADGTYTYLGALDLHAMTLAGTSGQVVAFKHGVPSSAYPENTYIKLHPRGFRQYATQNFMSTYNGNGVNLARIDTTVFVPILPVAWSGPLLMSDPRSCVSGSCPWGLSWILWPQSNSNSGANYRIDDLHASLLTHDGESNSASTQNRYARIRLTSMLPYTQYFQAKNEGESAWTNVAAVSSVTTMAVSQTLEFGFSYWGMNGSKVRLRAIDNFGNATKEVYFVPRYSNN